MSRVVDPSWFSRHSLRPRCLRRAPSPMQATRRLDPRRQGVAKIALSHAYPLLPTIIIISDAENFAQHRVR